MGPRCIWRLVLFGVSVALLPLCTTAVLVSSRWSPAARPCLLRASVPSASHQPWFMSLVKHSLLLCTFFQQGLGNNPTLWQQGMCQTIIGGEAMYLCSARFPLPPLHAQSDAQFCERGKKKKKELTLLVNLIHSNSSLQTSARANEWFGLSKQIQSCSQGYLADPLNAST